MIPQHKARSGLEKLELLESTTKDTSDTETNVQGSPSPPPCPFETVTHHPAPASTLPDIGLIDTATEIARWEAEAKEKERKLEEARLKNEEKERAEKARQKREQKLEFTPVPVASVQRAENVSSLYLMATKRNITPVFEFETIEMYTFKATLKLQGITFPSVGPFPNKKEAKEAAAKLGVDYLNSNPDLRSISPTASPEVAGAVNVAELTMLVQKFKIPLPEYQYMEDRPQQFSVTMILNGELFEPPGLFPSKKQAKDAVSRLGVAHIKEMTASTLGSKSSVELGQKLQSLVNKHNIDPYHFDILPLPDTPYQYRARLTLGEEIFEEAGPFATKEEARYEISKHGLAFLEKQFAQEEEEEEEDWVSQLNLFTQASTSSPPTYQDFRESATTQDLWASEVKISQRSEPFGRSDLPFPSKKKARQNAAHQAIEWLRKQNLISEDNRPFKKQKIGLRSGSRSAPSLPIDILEDDGVSFAKQVNDLCLKHSIPVPTYEIKPSHEAIGPFYSGCARFANFTLIRQGRPIGHVDKIYGQKRAKEEVAKNVFRILKEYVSELDRLDSELLKEAGFNSSGRTRLEDVPLDY